MRPKPVRSLFRTDRIATGRRRFGIRFPVEAAREGESMRRIACFAGCAVLLFCPGSATPAGAGSRAMREIPVEVLRFDGPAGGAAGAREEAGAPIEGIVGRPRLESFVIRFELREGERVLRAKGILRAGYFLMPMDETLAVAAVDLSGRSYLVFKGGFRNRLVGDLQTELIEDFFGGFATAVAANVHLKVTYGRSTHHRVEGLFKAFARALRFACSRDQRLRSQLPSTKGLL